jgi:predicted dehydrogenase
MIKIGMLSAAHVHAYSYANILKKLENVEFVGLYDPDEERGKNFARALGINFVPFSEIEKCDVVVITSENRNHLKDVESLAGKVGAILCEKPLSTNADDAKKMVEICKEKGTVLGTAFPVRYTPTIKELKRKIDNGELGEIYMIAATNRGKMPPGWFLEKELSGGGAIMDHVVHVVDILRWLTGKEFKNVTTFRANQIHKDIEVEDTAVLMLELDGIPVSLDCSWNRPVSFPTWGDVTLRIVGTKEVLEVDVFNSAGFVYSNESERISNFYVSDDGDELMLKDFIDAYIEKRTPFTSGEDGLRATEVVEAAYKSLEKGGKVEIEMV